MIEKVKVHLSSFRCVFYLIRKMFSNTMKACKYIYINA